MSVIYFDEAGKILRVAREMICSWNYDLIANTMMVDDPATAKDVYEYEKTYVYHNK